MGFEFWIWIAIAIITLIARMGRKKRVDSPKPRAKPRSGTVGMDQARTFEELLEEIEKAKKPPSPEPSPPDIYPPTVTERDTGQEKTTFYGDITYVGEPEKELPSQSPLMEVPLSKTKKTPLQAVDHIAGEDKDKGGKLKSAVLTSLFSSPDELKKAFVLKEVLDRKY